MEIYGELCFIRTWPEQYKLLRDVVAFVLHIWTQELFSLHCQQAQTSVSRSKYFLKNIGSRSSGKLGWGDVSAPNSVDPLMFGSKKGYTYLNKPAARSYRFA